MMFKNFNFVCFIFLLLSCSNENSIDSVSYKEQSVMNFESTQKMQNRIDEIIKLKTDKEIIASNNFFIANKSYNINNNAKNENEALIIALKKYHLDVLRNIYDIRKEINFVSIQSIADEINSLKLIDPKKAQKLQNEHSQFLTEYQGLTKTIYDNRIANIINLKGIVNVNGKKISVSSLRKNTGKYIQDEYVRGGVAASTENITVYYSAGRELHENDLGVNFFRYYTELLAVTKITFNPFLPPMIVPIPVTYTVNPGSKAGFVQTGSNFFGDYAFSYDYISGFGPAVRNTGGKKNVAYKPAGGNLSATFSTTINGVQKIMVCDFTYSEE